MPWHPLLRYLSEVRLLLNFLYAGYANFYATVRSQAGDQLSLGLDAVTLGAGDRVGFAATFDGNLAGSHTLADQGSWQRCGHASLDSFWL